MKCMLCNMFFDYFERKLLLIASIKHILFIFAWNLFNTTTKKIKLLCYQKKLELTPVLFGRH